jgi:hypothetical protein
VSGSAHTKKASLSGGEKRLTNAILIDDVLGLDLGGEHGAWRDGTSGERAEEAREYGGNVGRFGNEERPERKVSLFYRIERLTKWVQIGLEMYRGA